MNKTKAVNRRRMNEHSVMVNKLKLLNIYFVLSHHVGKPGERSFLRNALSTGTPTQASNNFSKIFPLAPPLVDEWQKTLLQDECAQFRSSKFSNTKDFACVFSSVT